MKRMSLCSLAIVTLCAGASAQFDQFEWTLDNHGDMDVGVLPNIMYFNGDHADAAGSVAVFTTSSPVAGRATVSTYFWIEELVCGSAKALTIFGNQATSFSNCSYSLPISLDVAEGQTFGFGMSESNPLWSATLALTNFTFTPCWTPLGGALAGTGGAPALEGHGLLKPGIPFSVQLADAKPSSAVALVVGFTEANLPFKGGVLVPSPDALLLGLASDANGDMNLASIWPAGVPAGFGFVAQGWITDPAGPHGFAASNAVKGFAP